MTNVKGRVKEVLLKATTWLSVSDVIDALGANERYASIRRALAHLWRADLALSKAIAGDRYGRRQWIHADNENRGFADAKTPTKTIWDPNSKKPKTGRKQTKRSGFAGTTMPITSNPISTTNQGDLIMQIEQGVETIVSEWVAADKKFTAHDVTKELRDRVNAGSIQVDPGLAGTVHISGKDVTKIEHSLVRDAVHALMTSDRFDYDRNHNGQFFEYFPMTANTVAASPADPGTPSTPPAADGSTYDGKSTL